jgi:excinuclease ABC subunit A
VRDLTHGLKVDRYKNHFIEIVIDKLVADEASLKRLKTSVQTGMKHGDGIVMILDADSDRLR